MAYLLKPGCGPARQIVCTIHDNIPASIFEPQILMTIGGIQKRLKRLLESEAYCIDRGQPPNRQVGAGGGFML